MLRFALFLFICPALLAQPVATRSSARPVLKAQPLTAPTENPRPTLKAEPVLVSPSPEARARILQATGQPVPKLEPEPGPIDELPTGDDAVRLQIFLDDSMFGPGVIDGKPGRFTKLAIESWNEVNGHDTQSFAAVNTAARKAVPNPHAMAVVPDIAPDWVDPELPYKRSEQAEKKRMSYRSIGEFMAERYHCDVPYLIELNGKSKVYNLTPRDTLIVPNVTPFKIEAITGTSHKSDPVLSERHIVVDTRINQVRIFKAAPKPLPVTIIDGEIVQQPATRANSALVASFPITPGQPKFIKLGTWELRNMIEFPWWRYDQSMLDHGVRSENALNIPPGPNSPVGIIWNGTSRSGIGLHGTSDPETIGRARSAGCIRLANWDAIRLPTLVRPGASVEIR